MTRVCEHHREMSFASIRAGLCVTGEAERHRANPLTVVSLVCMCVSVRVVMLGKMSVLGRQGSLVVRALD